MLSTIRTLVISTCLILTQVAMDSALAEQDTTQTLQKNLASNPDRFGEILLEEFDKSAGNIPALNFKMWGNDWEKAELIPDFAKKKSLMFSLPLEGRPDEPPIKSAISDDLFTIFRSITDVGPLLKGPVRGPAHTKGNSALEHRASSTGLVFAGASGGYEIRIHSSNVILIAVLPNYLGECARGRPLTKYCSIGYVW